MSWAIIALVVLVVVTLPFYLEARRTPVEKLREGEHEGRFADLPGGKTYYRWSGPVKGPVAVCVHGQSTSSYVWDAIIKIMTTMGFRVLSYDLYGRGLSDRIEGRQDPDFFFDQLNELLEDQEVEDGFSLLGFSMGGAIVAAYATRYKARLDRIVLIAPAGIVHHSDGIAQVIGAIPILGDWFYLAFKGWLLRRGIRAEAAVYKTSVPDVFARQAAETRTKGYLPAMLSSQRHLLDGMLDYEHEMIAGTDLPVLAIWGEADTVIPLTGLGVLAQINRASRQFSIKGAPHGLPYTHPGDIRAALQDFLRDGL